jgi:hypothetical protein
MASFNIKTKQNNMKGVLIMTKYMKIRIACGIGAVAVIVFGALMIFHVI